MPSDSIPRLLAAAAAIVCAVAVAAGAFGAHGLKARLDPQALEQWNTAARYFLYAGFGAFLASLAAPILGGRAALAGWVLLAGGAVFAGAVGGLALGSPRWFGAVAPLGGLGLIVGFLILAWAALAAWVCVAATTFLASAQSLETREAELAAIRDKIVGLRSEVDQIKQREESLEDRLERVTVELNLQEARLAEAAAALEVASLRAAEAEGKIGELETDLDEVRDDLRRRLTGLYRLGHRGYLRLFLSMRPDQDLLPALRQLRFLVLRDQRALDRFVELRDALLVQQEKLEAQRTEMAQWRTEEATRRDELVSMRDVRAKVLDRVADRRRELAKQARELEEKERKLTRFIDTLVAGTANSGAADSGAAGSGTADSGTADGAGDQASPEPVGTSIREFRGVLDWPVADPKVSIEFGPRRDPRYLTEVPHNGLGLQVAEGTRVRTVYPGEVLYAAEFEGYGPMVVVRHAGRVFTLYAGLQLLNVGSGDVLSLGDVLGASGESLYFEIRVDNQPEDPRTWLR